VSERGGVTKDGWLFSLGGIAYFIGAGLNGTLDRSFEAMFLARRMRHAREAYRSAPPCLQLIISSICYM
jgi:hypothetical protein